MKVISRLTAVAAAVVFAAPMGLTAQALPKAEDLFAKHVAAVGGKDALSKITSTHFTGKFELPAMGMSADFENSTAAPNKMAMKMTIPGMGEIQRGYDGTTAWELNPMQGPRLLADKELLASKDNANFYCGILYSPDCYTSTTTVGDTTFAGEKAYKVKAVFKSGREESMFFSATTGLKIGSSEVVESQMGTQEVVSTESDYKQFGPVKLATKTEQSIGPQKIIITIVNVTFGDVPATAFTMPDAVKALIKP